MSRKPYLIEAASINGGDIMLCYGDGKKNLSGKVVEMVTGSRYKHAAICLGDNMAAESNGSLCTENIVLLCSNCHREIHYGNTFSVKDNTDIMEIVLSKQKAKIKKNTMEHLSQIIG